MKGYIYGLKCPIKNVIVYIGATKEYPTARYVQHYRQLDEVLNGKRKNTKKFEYMKNLLPLKLKLIIIEEVDILELYNKEQYYIDLYRKTFDLLNETNGGIGGNTHIYKSEKEISAIGLKISEKLKGKPKPKGFAEKLSANRTGLGNPAVKQFSSPVFCTDEAGEVVAEFSYSFEIDEWLNRKGAWSNISKALNNPNRRLYGYYWKK